MTSAYSDISNLWMRDEASFKLCRSNLIAFVLYKLFDPIRDVQVAFAILVSDIPCSEVSIMGDALGCSGRIAIISFKYGRSFDPELS